MQDTPSNPDAYFSLATLLEEAGRHDEAEQVLLQVRDLTTDGAGTSLRLAQHYLRRGQFDRATATLRARATLEPDNPELFYTLATAYWEWAFRDRELSPEEKASAVTLGIGAVDAALELRPDYVQALVYKNILLRMQAVETEDPSRQADLVAEADALRDRAMELQG